MRPNEREELVLTLAPVAANLCESCRDDAEGAGSPLQRRLDPVQHVLGRQADDDQVRRLGELLDRPVAANTGDGVTGRVHRVGDAFELPRDDVAEEQAADRFPPLGCTEHGDARGREEGPERGDGGEMVALVHPLEVRLGGLDPELDLDGPALERPRALEPHSLEDAEHRAVLREDLCDEALDADRCCALGELLQQSSADSAPLVGIGHQKGDLGRRRIAEPHIARERDHPPFQLPDQMPSFVPVGLDELVQEPLVHGREAVEAVVEALRGEPTQELEERPCVRRLRRPQPKRRPVAEDDVERLRRGARRLGGRRLSAPRQAPSRLRGDAPNGR